MVKHTQIIRRLLPSILLIVINHSVGLALKGLKTAYAPNFVWSSGLKASGIFVILLSQDGFECDWPEKKFQKITF